MLVFSWITVFNPNVKVYWGRGRSPNRVLLSRRSKLGFAVAVSGWCLGVFQGNQLLAIGLFLVGLALAVISGRQDEQEHVARTGVPLRRPATSEQTWMALCAMDVVFLTIAVYAFVRDYFHPPVTDEEKSVHVAGIVLLVFLSVAALALYLTRPSHAGDPSKQ